MSKFRLVIEHGRIEQNYWQDIWRYRELFAFLAWQDIWRYRELFAFLAWQDILVRYKQTFASY